MSRKFIAAIVALSLTVTGVTASQAEAGDKRTRNLIVGAATLAIIGAAIANQNRQERNTHVGTSNSHHRHPAYNTERPRHRTHSNHGVQPRPLPPRARRIGQLPGGCLQSYPTRGGGALRMYGARCLHQNYAFADRLPRECRQRIWTPRGTRVGYSARCLHQYQRSAHNQRYNRR